MAPHMPLENVKAVAAARLAPSSRSAGATHSRHKTPTEASPVQPYPALLVPTNIHVLRNYARYTYGHRAPPLKKQQI